MIPVLVLAAAYLILLGFVALRRLQKSGARNWLLFYCLYSAALMGLHALLLGEQITLPAPLTPSMAAIAGLVISFALIGFLTLSYLGYGLAMKAAWGGLSLAWAVGVFSADLLGTAPLLADRFPDWGLTGVQISLGSEILGLGWLLMTAILFVAVGRSFLSEPLPLRANRILFWGAVLPLLIAGDTLSAWLKPPWNYTGYVLRLLAAIGAVYGVVAHRVPDLRDITRWVINRSILTLVNAALILGAVLATLYLPLPPSLPVERWVVGLVAALLLAVFSQPINQLFRWLLERLGRYGLPDPAEAARQYSRRISGVIDLTDLADVVTQTINELLGTRRGCLIMATPLQDHVALEIIGGERQRRPGPVYLSLESPIYRYFTTAHRPLLQYDLDYHQDFAQAPDAELDYFRSLEMAIYAPIIGEEDELIGLLALGPKSSDEPFRPPEIDLLAALAQQTVVALNNARLVSDLRSLNREISALNEDLRASNQRLERLDAVKSDFILIASHELRTPLTQIQGYADLLFSMTERNLLDSEQMNEITHNLSLACQRMTDVIASVLDVSQIDVESLDLTFTETSLSSIVKLAIEPYADAIHERNLTLVARGLRNLPSLYCDYQRLVQAFKNLITNAIKFTPDGGRITITGQIYEKDQDGNPLSLRVMVSDNGIGIDEADQELIFDKFYRVDPVSHHSTGDTKFKGAGSGLGLAITKGIIEGHGGRIWVESEGRDEEKRPGSTFHVVLPIRPPAMDARERMLRLKEAAEAAKDETIIRKRPPDLSSPASSSEG